MKINVCGAVDGVYGIKVKRNAGTDEEFIEDCGLSANLLTDNFFSSWLSGLLRPGSWRFYVGTGTTPPSNSDLQLQSILGGASNQVSVTPNPVVKIGSDYFASSTGVGEWPIGALTGNISEIGANLRGAGHSATSLHSRALIVDFGGNPTTITLTAADQLVVSYTLRYKIPVEPHISQVTFDGVLTTCTLETLGVFDVNHWGLSQLFSADGPFAVNSQPRISSSQGVIGNVESNAFPGSAASCSPSYSSTGTARRVTLTASTSQWNSVGNIRYVTIMSPGVLARQGIHFDPPLAKNNLKNLVLHFDYTLARA